MVYADNRKSITPLLKPVHCLPPCRVLSPNPRRKGSPRISGEGEIVELECLHWELKRGISRGWRGRRGEQR